MVGDASAGDERSTLVNELFAEAEHPVFSLNYRHGYLRTLLVVARSLLSGWRAGKLELSGDGPRRLAVVFFDNESQAATRAREARLVEEIVRLDNNALAFLWRELGVGGMSRAIADFLRIAIRQRGIEVLAKCSVPLLGWLLYRGFLDIFARHPEVRVVTTNLQHPTSLGVHYAARRLSLETVYLEHATTSSLGFRDRQYDLLLVNLPHTKEMLQKQGVAPSRIQLIGSQTALSTHVISPPVWEDAFGTAALCINDLDSLEAVDNVTTVLQARGLKVVYRIHDSDLRWHVFQKLARARTIQISSARESRINDFMPSVDFLIAGNSNVVADCLQQGKPVIYYWEGTAELFDYYGLIAYYDVPHARSRQGLQELLDRLLSPAHGGEHRVHIPGR